MMSFGGLHNDPFLNGMMGFGGDPFEDMFKFSDGKYVIMQFIKMFIIEERKDLTYSKVS